MLQDLAEILGGNPEESEILDIIEFEHKLTNISVPRYENSVCTLLMNQHSLQDPNASFGGTLQLHDNTRTKKVSTQHHRMNDQVFLAAGWSTSDH